MAQPGDRVLYRALEAHHTTVEEHVHDEVGGKRVPRYDTVHEPVMLEDGEVKTPKRDANGQAVTKPVKVPVMRVTHEGSVHHPHLRTLVGLVANRRELPADNEHPLGRVVYDVMLLVPNRAPEWVEAAEGDGEGTFTVREDAEDRALKVA